MITIYDAKSKKWRRETKEEVMQKEDIEGNTPCDDCWEEARDNGVYNWPLKLSPEEFKRCPTCNRNLGMLIKNN